MSEWLYIRPPTAKACRAIDAANEESAAFFRLPADAKAGYRRAAAAAGGALPNQPQPQQQQSGDRVLATAGVGYLQGPTREWLHLAADDSTLAAMRWPSDSLRSAVLALLALCGRGAAHPGRGRAHHARGG